MQTERLRCGLTCLSFNALEPSLKDRDAWESVQGRESGGLLREKLSISILGGQKLPSTCTPGNPVSERKLTPLLRGHSAIAQEAQRPLARGNPQSSCELGQCDLEFIALPSAGMGNWTIPSHYPEAATSYFFPQLPTSENTSI